jgi:hypothetical protein
MVLGHRIPYLSEQYWLRGSKCCNGAILVGRWGVFNALGDLACHAAEGGGWNKKKEKAIISPALM